MTYTQLSKPAEASNFTILSTQYTFGGTPWIYTKHSGIHSRNWSTMAFHLRFRPSLNPHFNVGAQSFTRKPVGIGRLSVRNCSSVPEKNVHKLVMKVKEKLAKDYSSLPVGKNGRDDEEMIHWFLKDRNFSVDETISKLAKAIRWRHEFGVSELSEESVSSVAKSGKSYVHDHLDVHNRPVLMVDVSKHIPGEYASYEDEKLCVYLIEKALSMLPPEQNQILGIIDLRGFGTENADLKFITFVFDVFYYYYPRRLGQVLFVDAPFIFKPVWLLIKPLLRSYASLVKFCSAKEVKEEYFTTKTVPATFRR